jgi:hypothetical protein
MNRRQESGVGIGNSEYRIQENGKQKTGDRSLKPEVRNQMSAWEVFEGVIPNSVF